MNRLLHLPLAVALLLSACGQTGPLYLPDEPAATPTESQTAAPPGTGEGQPGPGDDRDDGGT